MSSSSSSSCCNRKCGCIFLILLYVCFDLLVNAFFVTRHFTEWPDFSFSNYTIQSSMMDVWCVSLGRDVFTMIVTIVFAATTPSHRFAYLFVRWIHKNYVSAFLCLVMYAFTMIKMLLHADQRPRADRILMLMFIWNIGAAFLFFIAIYMLALSKPKIDNYRAPGDDEDDNIANERDIFIETLKETNQKRSSLSRLFKYSRPDWYLIVSGTFFLLLGAICEAFVPYYTGQVLDSITVQKNFDQFKKDAVLFIAVHFASGVFGGIRTCLFNVAVSRLNVRLRKMVFRALIEQDISFFDKVKTGDMLSRLSADTTTMSDLISQNLNGFLWNLVRTIGTLIFILKLSWQLSLTCFIGAPVVLAVGKLYGAYYRKLSVKVQSYMAEANSVAEESLSTIRTVRSFANEDGEIRAYAHKLRHMLKFKIRQSLVFTTYDWAVKIAELCMTITMLSYGAHLVTTSQISSGDFISFVIFQLTLAGCLEGLTSVYTGLMSAAGASEKVFEYLDIKPQLQITRAYEPDSSLQGSIEFRGVTFTYPTRPDLEVLKSVTFSVKPGEVVALVGPSGSGKSSCISLLERFYKPDRGEILVDGIPLTDYNHKYIHRVISLVGQEPVLYARKIRENIAYGMENEFDDDEVLESRVVESAKMANAHTFILETPKGYDTECGERGTQMSGGQKQRIAIARALIRNPRILLLDEATSALDAESEYLVQQAIHKNLRGHTVVIVAHRLSTIENADKIIVLDHGQIVEQGDHKELLKQDGLYAYLVRKQMHGDDEDSSNEDNADATAPITTPRSSLAINNNINKRSSGSS